MEAPCVCHGSTIDAPQKENTMEVVIGNTMEAQWEHHGRTMAIPRRLHESCMEAPSRPWNFRGSTMEVMEAHTQPWKPHQSTIGVPCKHHEIPMGAPWNHYESTI